MKHVILMVIAVCTLISRTALGQGGPDPVGLSCYHNENQHCCDYAGGMTIQCTDGEVTWSCSGEPDSMWNPTIRIAVPSGSLFTGGQYLSPDKSCKCKYHAPICGEEWPDCEIEVALTSWTTYWAQPLFADPCP